MQAWDPGCFPSADHGMPELELRGGEVTLKFQERMQDYPKPSAEMGSSDWRQTSRLSVAAVLSTATGTPGPGLVACGASVPRVLKFRDCSPADVKSGLVVLPNLRIFSSG